MLQKQKSLLGLVLIFSGGMLAFSNVLPNKLQNEAQASASRPYQSNTGQEKNNPLPGPAQVLAPDSVLFDLLFHRLRTYAEQDDQLERTGQPRFFEAYAKGKYNLSAEEAEKLQSVAQDYLKQADALDGQARKIIDEGRAKFPKGEIKPGETAPPPPPELGILQQRRDEALLSAQETLKASVTEATFLRLQQTLRTEAEGNLKPLQFLVPTTK